LHLFCLTLLESREEKATGFAARVEAAVHAHSVQLLAATAVDLQNLEAWRDVPDVDKGDVPKLAAPLHGDADAVEEGEDHVGQVLAAVEAFVAAAPHAVHGVGALRLGEDVLEGDLEMVIDVVGVTVHHIELRHFEF